jgi:hypothetical protein
MERREAPAFSKRERGKTEDWCAARCSIPSLYAWGKEELRKCGAGTTAYPAPQRIRAMTHACLEFGCLTIGSESTRVFPRGSGRTESYRRSTSASRTAPLI